MTEPEYEPFGKEWEASLLTMRKSSLIDLLKSRCLEVLKLKEEKKKTLTDFIEFYEKIYRAKNEYNESKEIIQLYMDMRNMSIPKESK